MARALAKAMALNFDYLLKRALGRPTCLLAKGAKLGTRARILNARDSSEYISVGNDSVVLGELFVFAHGGQIEIGQNCLVDLEARVWSAGSIVIEDNVVIGPRVNVFDSLTHPIRAAERHEQVKSIFSTGHPKHINLNERPVRIRRGAMIGAGAFILRGVTISENEVIAPGEVVTKSR